MLAEEPNAPKTVAGLKALPWLEEARSKSGQRDLLNCDTCLKYNETYMRRVMHCGLMPESEHLPGMRWIPDGLSDEDVSICPGYTTTLPEVIEAIGHYHSFESGQLRDACGDRTPPRSLFEMLTLLKGSVLSKDAYRAREAKDNQGGNHGPR